MLIRFRSFRSVTSSSLRWRICERTRQSSRTETVLIHQQLLRHRAARNRSPPSAHISTARKTIHPILPLPNPSRSQICPFRRCRTPRSETLKYPRQRKLRSQGELPDLHRGVELIPQDLRLWASAYSRSSDDGICFDEILSGARDHVDVAKV